MAEPTNSPEKPSKVAQVTLTLDLESFQLLITGKVPSAPVALAMLRWGVDEYEYICTIARHGGKMDRIVPAHFMPSGGTPGRS